VCRAAALQLNKTTTKKDTKTSMAKTQAMGICTKNKQNNYKSKNNTTAGMRFELSWKRDVRISKVYRMKN